MAEFSEAVSSCKLNNYRKTETGKFICLICERSLSSKQNILIHLHKVHKLSPVKRKKKLYLDDESIAVPRRTLLRWKGKVGESSKTLNDNVNSPVDSPLPGGSEVMSFDTDKPESTDVIVNDELECRIDTSPIQPYLEQQPYLEPYLEQQPYLEQTSFDITDPNSSDKTSVSVASVSLSDISEDSETCEITSDINDSNSIFSEDYAYSSSEQSTSSEDLYSSSGSSDENVDLTKQESQALSLLSCFLRNNLSASACKDILETMSQLFPDSEAVSALNFKTILSYVDESPVKDIHYCILCNKLFPEDRDMFRCNTENCEGLRYKGSVSVQLQKGRLPRQYFVMADTGKQLISLLQTPGIWDDIKECKYLALERKESDIICDITDGMAYQELYDGFLSENENNLTAIFNTDGVNLYSSSNIQLWPIFLAINELSPPMRFSRDNMLLAGLWQGKGKPPFRQYFEMFSEEMNHLFNNGVEIKIRDSVIDVKLLVVCAIADLPAKAELLKMTYFNGKEACILCEEPGIVVKQGKGTARCYPYRSKDCRYKLRNHLDVITCMQKGRASVPCKGFKGMSGLVSLESYDVVKGSVPEYMHGVLLGITKTLLSKWFSPSNSQKKHFIGRNLKTISQRMKNIKPPNSIERLPRDLEKQYNHLKATELQAFLLYYAIPCLDDFLPEEYMSNLTCLSEAIYILLGDSIAPASLERAEMLLDKFYCTFQNLYGDGSCGLNVHNVGVHLVPYVRLWGPLWAWSCFPFEDINSMLLQAVHGTGTVLNQVMRYRQAHAHLHRKGYIKNKGYCWKVTHKSNNCNISGSLKTFKQNELDGTILSKLEVNNVNQLRKADRITVNGSKFFSGNYSRMQRRICSVVLYNTNKIGSILYFVLRQSDNNTYAVLQQFKPDASHSKNLGGKHLQLVRSTRSDVHVISVENLHDTLVFININSHQNQTQGYVAKMPNRHGHSIFK